MPLSAGAGGLLTSRNPVASCGGAFFRLHGTVRLP